MTTTTKLPRDFLAQAVYTLSQLSPARPVIVNGKRYTRKDFEDETPAILVESPLPNQKIKTPLHATGAGKALLAALPAPRRDALIERLDLRGHTPRTIVERPALRRALEEIRERGYAIDDEEYDEGVRCVAVAVGPPGAPIAALSISAPANRLSRQRCAELVPLLRRAAAELADSLRDQARAAP